MKEYEKLAKEYRDQFKESEANYLFVELSKDLGTEFYFKRSQLEYGFIKGFLKAREMAVKVWHETKGDCYITTRDLENLGEKEI